MVGIALLGAGIFAREQHLPAIESTSTFHLKAIYSRSEKTATSLAATIAAKSTSQVDVYFDFPRTSGKSLDELLRRTDIDAVIVCLAHSVQPIVIRKAIQAGKHVLSEKPIAPDVDTARDLIAWYESQPRRGLIWGVAENFRFNESVVYAANKVREIGGRLATFRLEYYGFIRSDNKYFNTEWRKGPEFKGGFLLDSGVHFIATLRLLLSAVNQEINQVVAYTSTLENHLIGPDTVHAIVATQDARHGTIVLSVGTECKTGLTIEIVTTNGTVTWSPVCVLSTSKSESGEMRPEEEESFVYNNAVNAEFEAFGQAVSFGTPDPRQAPVEALKDIRILQGLLDSGSGNAMVTDVGS